MRRDTQISLTEQMNKRAIVNVATGDFYCKMQERLIQSFSNSVDKAIVMDSGVYLDVIHCGVDRRIDLLYWKDGLPKGSRSHSESPYGFKVHAIKVAYEMGYTSILWLDSPAYAVKEDISPIFDKIEKEGYYAMSHIDPLENWVGDEAKSHFDVTEDSLKGMNLPSGSCYGFDISHPSGFDLVSDMIAYEATGFFKSKSQNHRHDEAIIALCMRRRKLPVFTFDPLFQSDSPECVIKSGGYAI